MLPTAFDWDGRGPPRTMRFRPLRRHPARELTPLSRGLRAPRLVAPAREETGGMEDGRADSTVRARQSPSSGVTITVARSLIERAVEADQRFSIGRTTPRHWPAKIPRAESPSPGSSTSKEIASYTAAWCSSFGKSMLQIAAFDDHGALVQEVARDPGRRDVLARRRGLEPPLVRVHCVERDRSLLSRTLIFGKTRLPVAEHPERRSRSRSDRRTSTTPGGIPSCGTSRTARILREVVSRGGVSSARRARSPSCGSGAGSSR